MNLAGILQIINILVIGALIAYQLKAVLKMRKYSYYWAILRWLCYKDDNGYRDSRGIKWFKDHPLYSLHWIFIITLIFLDVTFIGQILERDIMNGTFVKVISPLSWLCVLMYCMITEEITPVEKVK